MFGQGYGRSMAVSGKVSVLPFTECSTECITQWSSFYQILQIWDRKAI